MPKNGANSIKLTCSQIIFLTKLIASEMLHGSECRSRNRIVNILNPKLDEFEKNRMELINRFGEKDESGKVKTNPETNSFVLSNEEGFSKEYKEMIDEKIVIDIFPSNREDLKVVKNLVLNTKKDFGYADGEIYDEVCRVLEEI